MYHWGGKCSDNSKIIEKHIYPNVYKWYSYTFREFIYDIASNVKCEDRNDNSTTRMNKNALEKPFEYNLDSMIIVNKLF